MNFPPSIIQPPVFIVDHPSIMAFCNRQSVSDGVEGLSPGQIRSLDVTVAKLEQAHIEMELELQRSLPNLVHLISSFSPTLKHLQELLQTKNGGNRALWAIPPWLNEKERPREAKIDSGVNGIDGANENILELDTNITVEQDSGNNAEDTDATTSLTVEYVVERAQEEKAAAIDHICSILEPLAKLGADVRARELEKVFYVNSRGRDVDQEILTRGKRSAHGPNIQVDALLYDHRLFSGMSLGQRLGDTGFKDFYSIYPDQVAPFHKFPKFIHILNCHFTVKQIQRVPPTLFKISSGPFDYRRFLVRFVEWVRILRDKEIMTDAEMSEHEEAKKLYIELEKIGREAAAGWQMYLDHNTVKPRVA